MIKSLQLSLVIRLQQHIKELTERLVQQEDILDSKKRTIKRKSSIKHELNRIVYTVQLIY